MKTVIKEDNKESD